MTGFTVYLLRTVTGEVGSRIDPMTASWAIELNKIESGSIKVAKRDLLRRGAEWWAPYSGGVLITYTGPDDTERPITAGPITGWSAETAEDLTLDWAGIRTILAGRVIAQTMSYRGLSLGSIAWAIVDGTSSIKPAAGLPITHGSPTETATENADHQRTYERWNVANNAVAKRLTELSEVINGPDIMFRPEWVDDDHRMIRWSMVHGTEANPHIAQARTPDFDTTAPASDVADISAKSEAAHMVSRVWATGAGEGDGVARVYVEDLASTARGFPFLEKVISDNDQASPDKLRVKAQAALAESQSMIDQLTFSVRADSRKNTLGTFCVGDQVQVTVRGLRSIPDGRHQMRLIQMSGGLDEKVTLDFQKEVWD